MQGQANRYFGISMTDESAEEFFSELLNRNEQVYVHDLLDKFDEFEDITKAMTV